MQRSAIVRCADFLSFLSLSFGCNVHSNHASTFHRSRAYIWVSLRHVDVHPGDTVMYLSILENIENFLLTTSKEVTKWSLRPPHTTQKFNRLMYMLLLDLLWLTYFLGHCIARTWYKSKLCFRLKKCNTFSHLHLYTYSCSLVVIASQTLDFILGSDILDSNTVLCNNVVLSSLEEPG